MARFARTIIISATLAVAGCDGSVAASAAAQTPTSTFKVVNFAEKPGPITIALLGAEVTLQPIASDDADQIEVAAAIKIDGFQPIIVKEDGATSAYHSRGVGVGKLSITDTAPSVLLTGFTGGAHCCATLRVITPSAGKLKIVSFEPVDGGPDEAFPSDVDGDGTVDFVRQDDEFRYQFASGAGSFSPPVFLNIYKGQIVDVSDQPSFRPIWERFAVKMRLRCADRADDDRNGACAAYVAASARLGRFATAMNEAEKMAYSGPGIQLPNPCTVELVNYSCPAGKDLKFYTFKSALLWFLQQRGYI